MIFTEYVLPNGLTRPYDVSLTAKYEVRAAEAIAHGVVFECEILTTGIVSFTAELYNDEIEDFDTLAHELVRNGPDVRGAVYRVVAKAYKRTRA